MSKISLLIFSKDRAAQLDLLLRSIDINCPNTFQINVLYKYSNESYKAGYDRILADYGSECLFFVEDGFRNTTLNIIDSKTKSKYFAFLTDDCIAYDKFQTNEEELLDNNVNILSTRCGLNTTLQKYWPPYVFQQSLFTKESYIYGDRFIKWSWKDYTNDENYGRAMSLDGNIFCRSELLKAIRDSSWGDPRSLDGVDRNLFSDYFTAFHTSKIVCNSVNVSDNGDADNHSKFYHYSLEDLNSKYMTGGSIIIPDIHSITSSHIEFPLKFQ